MAYKNPEDHRAYSREYYHNNKDAVKAAQDKYNKANRALRVAHKRKSKYGLTQEDYDDLVRSQEGVCAICGGVELLPGGLSVDHDHDTLEIRGLLCRQCNAGLGNFKDDPSVLREALRYLEAKKGAV